MFGEQEGSQSAKDRAMEICKEVCVEKFFCQKWVTTDNRDGDFVNMNF